MVSLLAIGRTGVGKSTIGNVVLSGQPEGEFATSDDPASCTTFANARTRRNGNSIAVSFTDTPGIPDVNPNKSKEYYNEVIEAIQNEPLSAILFVFQYGRIDLDLYRKSAVLFREIEKAKCLKVLIINDHANRFKPLTENQYLELVQSISDVTNINYVFYKDCCFMNRETMVEKMNMLVTRLKWIEPVFSSHLLRSFDEMEAYVNTVKSDVERHEEARKLIEARIEDIKRTRKTLLRETLFDGGVAIAGACVAISHFNPVGVVAGVFTFRAAMEHHRERIHLAEELPEWENEREVTNQEIADAIEVMKEEEENFKTLAHSLHVTEE